MESVSDMVGLVGLDGRLMTCYKQVRYKRNILKWRKMMSLNEEIKRQGQQIFDNVPHDIKKYCIYPFMTEQEREENPLHHCSVYLV